jgi:hypothetical protein
MGPSIDGQARPGRWNDTEFGRSVHLRSQPPESRDRFDENFPRSRRSERPIERDTEGRVTNQDERSSAVLFTVPLIGSRTDDSPTEVEPFAEQTATLTAIGADAESQMRKPPPEWAGALLSTSGVDETNYR